MQSILAVVHTTSELKYVIDLSNCNSMYFKISFFLITSIHMYIGFGKNRGSL